MGTGTVAVDVPFVGRVDELVLIERLLGSIASGPPRLLLVTGEAGIGKSRLLAEAMVAARAAGVTVLHGACYEDVNIPYLPVATAFRSLDHEGARRLTSAPLDPGHESPGEAESRRLDVFLDATTMLVDAARAGPTMVVLDDLHWADDATAELVRHVVLSGVHEASAGGLPLLLVLSARGPWPDGVPRQLARLSRESSVLELHLERFDVAEAHALVTALAGARPRTETVRALLTATAGNPLLLRGVVTRNVTSGALVAKDGELLLAGEAPLTTPSDLDGEIRLELQRLSDGEHRVLAMAAVLGDGQSTAILHAACGDDHDGDFDRLLVSGVLRSDGSAYQFSHPQVRHIAYEDLDVGQRAALHLEVARALQEEGDVDEPATALAVAQHLQRGRADPNDAAVADWAMRAGDHAWAAGAWDDALAAYALALSGTGRRSMDPVALSTRLLRTGVAAYFSNDDSSVAWLEQAAAETEDPAVRAEALLLKVRFRFIGTAATVGAAPAVTELVDLLPQLEEHPALLARALATLADLHLVALDHRAAAGYAEEARAVISQVTLDPPVLAHVQFTLGLREMTELRFEAAEDWFEQAGRNADDHLAANALTRTGLCQLARGRLEEATATLEQGRRAERRLGSHAAQQLPGAALAAVAVLRGQFAAAERLCSEVESLYGIQEYAFTPGLVFPVMAAARAVRGDLAGAREALERWRTTGGRGTWRYQAYLTLVAGDVDALERDVRERRWRTPGDPTYFTLDAFCLHVLVGAALRDDDLVRSGLPALLDAHERGAVINTGWPWLLSRVIADGHRHLGDVAASDRWYRRAEAEAGRAGATLEAGLVALGLGHLAIAQGRTEEAAARTAQAAQTFDAAGALQLAGEAHALIGRTGGAPVVAPMERFILFSDIVGSTELNVRAGDEPYHVLLGEHDQILRARLRRHGGVEQSHTGDGMSAWFASADEALACALGMHVDLARASALHPELPVRVRIGIAAGRPVHDGGRLFGLAVVEAARVCALAGAEQVLVTEPIRDRASPRWHFEPAGEHVLKGIPDARRLFAASRRSNR